MIPNSWIFDQKNFGPRTKSQTSLYFEDFKDCLQEEVEEVQGLADLSICDEVVDDGDWGFWGKLDVSISFDLTHKC